MLVAIASTVISVLCILLLWHSSSFKYRLRRWVQIKMRSFLDLKLLPAWNQYYLQHFCNIQPSNNQFLVTVLQRTAKSAFARERSYLFDTKQFDAAKCPEAKACAAAKLVQQFRNTVPLTTYADYSQYIDRMVQHGEPNLLSSEKTVYYARSSGTTGKEKLIPLSSSSMANARSVLNASHSIVLNQLGAVGPNRRQFQLMSGKKPHLFERAKDGTPIGPLSSASSVISWMPGFRMIMGGVSIVSLDVAEAVSNFEASCFVQLSLGLVAKDISSFVIFFAATFLYAMTLLEKYANELCDCIAKGHYDDCELVRTCVDEYGRKYLAEELTNLSSEYGDSSHRRVRAAEVRKLLLAGEKKCLLARLWPDMVFASTTLGGSFSIYIPEIQEYCGPIPLLNSQLYISSEAIMGISASMTTNEYVSAPTLSFMEFIKEEDMSLEFPPTHLISEIEPGQRYEVVLTTDVGFYRYRVGDVVECTRMLSRDAAMLPDIPAIVPRCPMFKFVYRSGNLLNIIGEKTSEKHVEQALLNACQVWRDHSGVAIELRDFSSYMKLDSSPPRYGIVLEVGPSDVPHIDDALLAQRVKSLDLAEIERQLQKSNESYGNARIAGKFQALLSTVVGRGSFEGFIQNVLLRAGASPVQVKPHRLLKSESHLQYFKDCAIVTED